MSTIRMVDGATADSSMVALPPGHMSATAARCVTRGVSRFVRVLLLTAVTFCLVAPSATATPSSSLGDTLGDLWTTVLRTPTPQNPFTGGDTCVRLGGQTVSPFGPEGAESCTVNRATRIFVAAWTTECSTFEGPPWLTTEAELRSCAIAADAGITLATITVDEHPVSVTEVESGRLTIRLPGNNIAGVKGADRNGLSVAHGWVALLDPLPAGTHTIQVDVQGTINATHSTTIVVP